MLGKTRTMPRSLGDYAREFWQNLFQEMPYRTWWQKLVTNRLRAKVAFGCCGHAGEPGC